MDKSKAEKLLDFLRQKDKDSKIVLTPDVLQAIAQQIKIKDDEFFVNHYAHSILLMILGIENQKVEFFKNKFYQRIYEFCLISIKSTMVTRKINGEN